MSTSSTTPSFGTTIALKTKQRAESVSSASTDPSSDVGCSRGGFPPTALWRSAEVAGDSNRSPVPTPSTEWLAPNRRPYGFCAKRRRRRRKAGSPREKMVFGSFKIPAEPARLLGFKCPRRLATPDTSPSSEASIYLCKDGFDEAECIPGGKSVSIPRYRQREIGGLAALSFGKPVSSAASECAPLISPVSTKSPSSARSSGDEVGLSGSGSGCGSDWNVPNSRVRETPLPRPMSRAQTGL